MTLNSQAHPMNPSTQTRIVKTVLKDYGLQTLYRGHALHFGYPLLNLQGTVKMDRLLDSVHIRRAAEKEHLQTIEELFAGDELSVTTSERHLTVVSGSDPDCTELIRVHINHAAEEIARLLQNPALQEASAEAVPELLRTLNTPNEELNREDSREARLQRARLRNGFAGGEPDYGF